MILPTFPKADEVYYAQLEYGARYLASRSAGDAERREHLGMAKHYARLAHDAGNDNR